MLWFFSFSWPSFYHGPGFHPLSLFSLSYIFLSRKQSLSEFSHHWVHFLFTELWRFFFLLVKNVSFNPPFYLLILIIFLCVHVLYTPRLIWVLPPCFMEAVGFYFAETLQPSGQCPIKYQAITVLPNPSQCFTLCLHGLILDPTPCLLSQKKIWITRAYIWQSMIIFAYLILHINCKCRCLQRDILWWPSMPQAMC